LIDERRKVNINVQIQLGVNEYAADLAGNSTELAQKILTAVGGDEEKDMVSVQISDSGQAGSMPGMPAPEAKGK